MWLILTTINMHVVGDAEWMFHTCFLNTFGSSTRVKWRFSRKYNHTALSRIQCSSHGSSILSLTSQNTLTKTSVRHFPITPEAVTSTFMSDINHRNTSPLFSWAYTSINSRYTIICNSQDRVAIRATHKKVDNILLIII